jgi:catechol 2,3-dioxygenase-like lactoylglutathione lyase family enzyme
MPTPNPDHPVMELRVALTAADDERLVRFYCDGLGLEPAEVFASEHGHGVVLDMGGATPEIIDEPQAATIDETEAGRRISGQIRLALQVPDLESAMERLLAHGAILVHPRVDTPWGHRSVRLQDPEGKQVTLFQVLCSSPPS